MKNSFYFMIVGGEGCGKDTHADLLIPYFENKEYNVISTREPGGTFESEKIRRILLDKNNKLDSVTELFLYQAARKDLNEKIIKPVLSGTNNIILSKRGFPCTHAYQGFAGQINLDLVEKLNNISMEGVMPNKIYIIDIDPKIGLKKETNPDRFASKGLEYHQKVREGYLDFAEKYSDISKVISYQEDGLENMQKEIKKDLTHFIN